LASSNLDDVVMKNDALRKISRNKQTNNNIVELLLDTNALSVA
jgi:hypothetical protein